MKKRFRPRHFLLKPDPDTNQNMLQYVEPTLKETQLMEMNPLTLFKLCKETKFESDTYIWQPWMSKYFDKASWPELSKATCACIASMVHELTVRNVLITNCWQQVGGSFEYFQYLSGIAVAVTKCSTLPINVRELHPNPLVPFPKNNPTCNVKQYEMYVLQYLYAVWNSYAFNNSLQNVELPTAWWISQRSVCQQEPHWQVVAGLGVADLGSGKFCKKNDSFRHLELCQKAATSIITTLNLRNTNVETLTKTLAIFADLCNWRLPTTPVPSYSEIANQLAELVDNDIWYYSADIGCRQELVKMNVL